ncbi:hypothetical protein L963_1314 [Leuconostoc mesenteroides subsp. cremoris T26]|nr:hypothetical protein L963_1314 [Leuconostoc mesenteroides subsp. cremoris T26]
MQPPCARASGAPRRGGLRGAGPSRRGDRRRRQRTEGRRAGQPRARCQALAAALVQGLCERADAVAE